MFSPTLPGVHTGRRLEDRLLTFGSPWRHLYAEFFPTYFGTAATANLASRLRGRWRNLFRTTDPIGGPIDDPDGLLDVDGAPMADKYHRVHSDYWLEPEYGVEIGRLRAALGA